MKKKRLLSLFLAVIMLFGMLPIIAWGEVVPFTAEAGEVLEIKKSLEDYQYTVVTEYDENWNPVKTEERTVPLYEVKVPADVEQVTLFFEEDTLAYGYDESGSYVSSYGDYGDGTQGSNTAVIEDGFGNFVRVQTPYDEFWNSVFEYAIVFDVVEEYPFSVEIDGEKQAISIADTDYEYTVVLEYDENGNTVTTGQRTVSQYEVEVPAEAEEIILTFAEERLAYGYDASGNYVASYGDYGDGTTGQKSAVITADHLAEYVWVQTPYDSNWNSDFLYAIHLLTENGDASEPETGEVSVEELLKNIAKSYEEESDDAWKVLEMAVYEDWNLGTEKISENAKQRFVNTAIEKIAKGTANDKEYAKLILALTAIGVDATELYPSNDKTVVVNAFDGLKGTSSTDTWGDAFKLIALNQKEKTTVDEQEKALLQKIIGAKDDNGIWGTIQTTGAVLSALSFYKGYEDVNSTIETAINYLKTMQLEDGTFADGDKADANTVAMLIVSLAAVGIDPDEDADFVKNGCSAMDGLMNFALTDNSGFGYTNNTTLNSYATEQAFRAMIAASQVMKTGEAFNIYDFSHNADSLQPGYVKAVEDKPVESEKPKDDEITVKVSIKAIDEYWMKNKAVSIEEDSTVYDAFMEALEDSDIEQEGAKSGYIESMTKDGVTLGEFDEGENSGWLYKVNDELPDVGIKDYYLDDGDDILFYYTEDWKSDPDAGSRFEEEIPKEEEAAGNVSDLIYKIGEVTLESADAIKAAREAYDALTEEEKTLVENYDLLLAAEVLLAELLAAQEQVVLPAIEEIFTDMPADCYCNEAVQWAVANGIVSGVTETEFGPEWECSRGQLMTLIWRLMGKPEPRTQTIPYADVDKDMYYHDAILWAVENKLANGTDEISFSPEMTLTRGQAVAFLWRAAGMPEPAGIHTFADVTDTDYYAKAVLWAAENSITSGTGDGCFSPENPCTRGQIVTFLYRCFGK